jgi:hypothetical protein
VPLGTAPGFAVRVTVGEDVTATATATVAVAEPPDPVHVRVYVALEINVPVDCDPPVATLPDQAPDAVQDVALEEVQFNVELEPLVVPVGLAVRVIVGGTGSGGMASDVTRSVGGPLHPVNVKSNRASDAGCRRHIFSSRSGGHTMEDRGRMTRSFCPCPDVVGDVGVRCGAPSTASKLIRCGLQVLAFAILRHAAANPGDRCASRCGRARRADAAGYVHLPKPRTHVADTSDCDVRHGTPCPFLYTLL